FDDLSAIGKVLDYLWHMVLPVTASVVGNFAIVTILTKNTFLEEIGRQYVLTARAKGDVGRYEPRGQQGRDRQQAVR
ncbi:hypothetical protein SB758_43340, partial [Burkholderia sp. SIMBA_013]